MLQMTWELINGKSKEEVIKTIYPIIDAHFKNSGKSEEIFAEMIDKAIKLYEIYKSGGEFEI